MTDKPIRVGFIGLNPGIHWAATAHIPALKALPAEYEVVGVANTSLASARNAAEAFGLPHAFENAQALVNSPEVDLVVVKSNGATLLSIPLGHTLAGVREVLGDFGDVSARMINRRNIVHVTDTGEAMPKTSHDQILVQGALESGAAFSIHYRGGMSRGTNLLWEINGTQGDIQVTGANGHGQIVQLSIRGANGDTSELAPLTPPASAYDGWPDNSVARNVARVYALIAEDIRSGTRSAPRFRDAVALHETIDAIERSAARNEPK